MEELGVLYYVSSFPKLSESFILNEIAELVSRGHDIAVFAQNNPHEAITHEEYDNLDVPVYYADASYWDSPSLVSGTVARMYAGSPELASVSIFGLKHVGHGLLLGKRCAEFIDTLDFEVDVINAHFAAPSRTGAILAARHHNIACVITAHAHEIFQNPHPERVRRVCEGANHVIVPSDYNACYLRDQMGVKKPITKVPATTKIEKFEQQSLDVENRLLTVARLVEKKGHEYAIEAVKFLVDDGYDIQYHIVGRGQRERYLRSKVNQLGLEQHVEFLGHIPDDKLRQELNEASIFVLPCVIADDGDRDAMPVVLKEAMASETACVSTTVSAIPELITDGEDGVLVPPRNSELLATAIKDLVDDPVKRRRLGKAGRESVLENFDISHSVDRLVSVFNKVR